MKIIFAIICIMSSLNFAFAEVIGESKGSGTFAPDTISVYAVDDTDFDNVVCYTTDVEIGGFNMENPSDSSIACRLIGVFKGKPSSRKNVFSKSKNPFFKKLIVDRFYDKKRNVLVYLSFSRKLSGTNASHSVSVVPLGL